MMSWEVSRIFRYLSVALAAAVFVLSVFVCAAIVIGGSALSTAPEVASQPTPQYSTTQQDSQPTPQDSTADQDSTANSNGGDETSPLGANDSQRGATSHENTVRCTPSEIQEKDSDVVVIYRVKNGRLGQRCFGSEDGAVAKAWDALHEFANPDDLDAVLLFAGIRSKSLAAFTVGIGKWPYDQFAIAVDVSSARADADELRLTMAHEFSHVFAGRIDQSSDTSYLGCPTYHNGYVCFNPDSYVYEWISEFWDQSSLDELPRTGGVDEDAGDERCDLDGAFLGDYSASHPEEDLAESFSAFVYGVEVDVEVQPRLDFFLGYPELVLYRDQAIAAGQQNLPNQFGLCG